MIQEAGIVLLPNPQIWVGLLPRSCPEFPPCSPETTTSTTSSLASPPTTKSCDPGELGSGGGPLVPFLVSVPVILALAAAAATASSLLIWYVK